MANNSLPDPTVCGASLPITTAAQTHQTEALGDMQLFSDDGVEANTFRILLTTDTHIGYKDKDKVRGRDSLDVFEEVLFLAKQSKVDFILHCGDFFDEHKPSRNTMYETIKLLRTYCLGEGSIAFDVLSATEDFRFGLNYSNPNVNINLPIFVIHGNHDDPGEEHRLSPLDLLEASSMINYFGRAENLEDIRIAPILMQKGTTKLALYGLGWIRDERIHRALQSEKVKFLVPEGIETEEWFNLMLIHQNRFKGNSGGAPKKNCVHESMLPSFLDLVLWGHEHDCYVNPQESIRGDYHILQLGSSIQTSLSPAEALRKHVAILEIKNTNFRIVPLELLTVRPFGYQEICLSEMHLKSLSENDIWECLKQQVEILLKKCEEASNMNLQRAVAKLESSKNSHMVNHIIELIKEKAKLPLLRLKVDYTGCTTVNIPRFGAQFIGRVANPGDILLFSRKRSKNESNRGGIPTLILEDAEEERGLDIHDIIFQFLNEQNALDILPEPDMNIAVQDFVVKMETHAISNFVRKTIQDAKKAVIDESGSTQDIGNPATILSILRKRTDYIRSARLNETQEEDTSDKNGDRSIPEQPAASEKRLPTKRTNIIRRHEDDMPLSSDEESIFDIMGPRSEFGTQVLRKTQENKFSSHRNTSSVTSALPDPSISSSSFQILSQDAEEISEPDKDIDEEVDYSSHLKKLKSNAATDKVLPQRKRRESIPRGKSSLTSAKAAEAPKPTLKSLLSKLGRI